MGDEALPTESVDGRLSRWVAQPEHVGPYKILEPIGEGGKGTVYVAEQRTPVHRRVAVKVIKLGMDTKQVLARFEAEHHALAIMNHPNIVRVYDAGATAEGRPYFVMEHVQGISYSSICLDGSHQRYHRMPASCGTRSSARDTLFRS